MPKPFATRRGASPFGDHVPAELQRERLRYDEHPSSEEPILTDKESNRAGAVPFLEDLAMVSSPRWLGVHLVLLYE